MATRKLHQQLAMRDPVDAGSFLLSCRVRTRDGRLLPRKRYAGGDVGDHVLSRSTWRSGSGLLHTSTLVTATALARAVPWAEGLARHQDWDWVIRLQRSAPDLVIRQSGAVLVDLNDERAGGISAGTDWRVSRQWFLDRRADISARAFGDGLSTVSAALAARAGDGAGVRLCQEDAKRWGSPGIRARCLAPAYRARARS